MNRFHAVITDIQAEDALHIVSFDFNGTKLSMMSLELSAEIRIGVCVALSIKSTYIALAKSFEGTLSYANLIPARIIRVNNGKLLSSILLDANGFRLESIITADSSLRMQLAEEERVMMLVKASELSIIEVIE